MVKEMTLILRFDCVEIMMYFKFTPAICLFINIVNFSTVVKIQTCDVYAHLYPDSSQTKSLCVFKQLFTLKLCYNNFD